MLLQALYDYANDHRLLENVSLERRTLHALVPLDGQGRLQLSHLIPLTQPNAKGKEIAGKMYLLPRFPVDAENNGGKAYFLAEGSVAVFGRNKKLGEPIQLILPPRADRSEIFAAHAFAHFWNQIQAAYDVTKD